MRKLWQFNEIKNRFFQFHFQIKPMSEFHLWKLLRRNKEKKIHTNSKREHFSTTDCFQRVKKKMKKISLCRCRTQYSHAKCSNWKANCNIMIMIRTTNEKEKLFFSPLFQTSKKDSILYDNYGNEYALAYLHCSNFHFLLLFLFLPLFRYIFFLLLFL